MRTLAELQHETRRSWSGRFARGFVGGAVAGTLFLTFTAWSASEAGHAMERPIRLISLLVLDADSLRGGAGSVAWGLAIQAVLSVAFGMAFALVAPAFRSNASLLLGGAVYGALLYTVNFMIFAQTVFTFFQRADFAFQLLNHIIFGLVVSLFFLRPSQRPGVSAADVVAGR